MARRFAISISPSLGGRLSRGILLSERKEKDNAETLRTQRGAERLVQVRNSIRGCRRRVARRRKIWRLGRLGTFDCMGGGTTRGSTTIRRFRRLSDTTI